MTFSLRLLWRRNFTVRHHEMDPRARTTVDGRVILGIENFSMCVRKAAYASYQTGSRVFGGLSGTNFRTISVVPRRDNERNVYLEGEKI